jgi:hypothetical protein
MVLILYYLAELILRQSVEDMEQPINLMVDLETMVVLVADLYTLKVQVVRDMVSQAQHNRDFLAVDLEVPYE